MRLAALVIAAVSLVEAPRAEASACRTTKLAATPLATRATIGSDGGVLVGWTSGGADDAPDLDAVGRWQFVAGTRSMGLTSDQLAPGLWRMRPATPGRRATLRDDRGHRQVMVTTARTLPSPLPAPAATIEIKTWPGGPRGGGGSMAIATLASIPAGAVAIVVFPADDDDHAPALSWARVGGSSTVAVATTPGRCSPNPPGTRVPGVGEQVRLAWVDRHGRLSAESPPITTTAAPGTPTTPTP